MKELEDLHTLVQKEQCHEELLPPPPEPVLLIASPAALSVPGTEDCAEDLEAPTLRI